MKRLLTWTFAALLPMTALAQERLILRDGATFEGRMVGATERSITFRDNSGQMHRFDVDRVQSIRFGDQARADSYGADRHGNYNGYPQGAPPANNQYGNNYESGAYPSGNYAGNYPGTYGAGAPNGNPGYSMMLPAGTRVAVRTDEYIDARDATPGTSYAAQVASDVLDPNGAVLIPRGSEARLMVRRFDSNNLGLDLESIRVNGRVYVVDTSNAHQEREGLGQNKRTGEYVGGGAVLGTLLGAIAGGGRGAAIGALAGGAAGAGAEVMTKGNEIRVPAESVLTFRLDRPLYMNVAQ